MKKGIKAVRGGSGHMVGKTGVGPSKPNQMSNKGGGPKVLSGGRGQMVGFTGARPAKAC